MPTSPNRLKFRTDASFKAWLDRFAPDRRPPRKPRPPEPIEQGISWAATTTLAFSAGNAAICPPSGNIEERLEQLANVFVDNDQSKRALAKLDRQWKASKVGKHSVLLFTGNTRTGKTRILAKFTALHPPVREATESGTRTRWPVLFLPDIPSPCTAKGLCSAIFHQLGLQQSRPGREDVVIADTGQLLRDIGVEVLIVDEAQHILRGRGRDIESVAKFIRALVSCKTCQVVLSGLPILRRLVRRLRFVPMRHLSMESFLDLEPDKFQALLGQLCMTLGVPCEIKPSDQPLIEEIRRTGAVGSIITYFKAAAIHAISSGSQCISTDDFTSAREDYRGFGHIPEPLIGDCCQSGGFSTPSDPCPQADLHASEPYQLRVKRGNWHRPRQPGLLPISIEPEHDESFRSFLMRLAAANHYTNMMQFMDSLDFSYTPFLMTRRSLDILSIASDISAERLAYLAHVPVKGQRSGYGAPQIFQGRILPCGAIDDTLGVCPLCLAEGNYRRAIWDLRGLEVCLKHRILLIDSCPSCGEPCNHWSLPFGVCHWKILGRPCGTSFTKADIIPASIEGLRHAIKVTKWLLKQPLVDLPKPYHIGIDHLPMIAKRWTRPDAGAQEGQFSEANAAVRP